MATTGKTQRPLSVLLIGNSYTHFNAMPRMLEALSAASSVRPVRTQVIAPGGCTLERHWKRTGARGAIGKGGWDFVVLQEQSLRPIEDPALMDRYAGLLCEKIRRAGAAAVLYMTWARRHMPQMQDGLTAAYAAVARRCGAILAPVGEAWRGAFARRSGLVLHARDDSHPNRKGSYLTACTLYATIHGQSPLGLPGRLTCLDENGRRVVLVGLRREQARFLQQAAWRAVRATEAPLPGARIAGGASASRRKGHAARVEG